MSCGFLLFDFSAINYAAVVTCAVAFFVLGAAWFSAFFGAVWVQELGKHNIVIKEPTPAQLRTKMGLNFLKNVIVALALAWLVAITGSTTACSGFMLGAIIAFGFSVPAMADIFIWESRSFKLFLIDTGYQVIGVIMAAIILSVWR
jgi:hypothetical protein